MAFKSIIGATCACLAVVSFSANSANTVLIGRLAATEGGTDYQAYYDPDADLTWLADANAAGTTMNWWDANSWAAGLTVDGVDGWRLATTETYSSTANYDDSSEMGNLFYNVLGGSALPFGSSESSSLLTTHNVNYDLFSNVQTGPGVYWTATEYADTAEILSAWYFTMWAGFQGTSGKTGTGYAWAVQSGDVSAVPVPAAVWLFGSGLLGLIGLARRKSAKQSLVHLAGCKSLSGKG